MRKPKFANGWVEVQSGEKLCAGDEYFDHYNGKWYPTKCVGHPVGVPHFTSMRYRRRAGAQS